MNAAEAASRHEPDTRRFARRQRPTDRCRSDDALDQRRGEVARPELPRRGVEPAELGLGQTDHELAVEYADRRRHGAALANRPFGREADLDAFAGRKAVRDERRLQSHDAVAGLESRCDLGTEADHGIAPSCSQQRAAAASPSSGPPTRKPAASASPAPVVSTTAAATAG